MQPMDLFKKTALQECATILLGQLNVKENVHKREIFSYVYPNIAKELAFEKFYKWVAKQTTPTFQGYVVMSLFVPLASPTLPIDRYTIIIKSSAIITQTQFSNLQFFSICND